MFKRLDRECNHTKVGIIHFDEGMSIVKISYRNKEISPVEHPIKKTCRSLITDQDSEEYKNISLIDSLTLVL